MFDESFYRIDSGEIFHKSSCMWHERTTVDFLASMLVNFGYTKTDNYRIWKRGYQTVVVCFADDYSVCRQSWSLPPEQWFDQHTVIITDNYVNFPTQYQVKQVPESYFGVFNYKPDGQVWSPTYRFNFPINRLDSQRLLILLELLTQTEIDQDLVNFNCFDAARANHSLDEIKTNFMKTWNQLVTVQEKYKTLIPELTNNVPIRNHALTIEQAHVSAWVNIVVETYAGDHTIAFSEKIFRALVSPAPWTVYSAFGAVNYLKQLGFDVLDDIVDHTYNLITQDDTPHGIKKVETFISSNIRLYQELQKLNFEQVKKRCQQAAIHNQQRLAELQQQWPADFAQWLLDVLPELKTGK